MSMTPKTNYSWLRICITTSKQSRKSQMSFWKYHFCKSQNLKHWKPRKACVSTNPWDPSYICWPFLVWVQSLVFSIKEERPHPIPFPTFAPPLLNLLACRICKHHIVYACICESKLPDPGNMLTCINRATDARDRRMKQATLQSSSFKLTKCWTHAVVVEQGPL